MHRFAPLKPRATAHWGALAIVAISIVSCTRGSATARSSVGFWFERDHFDLPPDIARTLGGALSAPDMAAIETVATDEVAHAFQAFNVAITDRRDAFWRVEVVPSLPARGPLPRAGASIGLGPLGGRGAVEFGILAYNAVRRAPPGASRQTIIDGIGRGIGRAAVHEFAHQMFGEVDLHQGADENSYEYARSDRTSQYYGELRWTTALPMLRTRFGTVKSRRE